MDSRNAQKLAEAEAAMREGDKCMSKSLFKWKADYEGAILAFDKAGTAYKNAKAYDKAKEAYLKLAQAQEATDLTFVAAKSTDLAAQMSKELNQINEAVELLEKASTMYRISSNSEKAADTLVRAAKLIESSNSEKAIELAKNACEIFEVDDKLLFSSDTFRYTAGVCLKAKKIDEAIEIMKQQVSIHEKLNQTSDVYKLYLSVIIAHLSRDDYVAADRAYQDYALTQGFAMSSEGKVAGELLDAFEKRSNENLQAIIKKQVFNFLPNEIQRIVQKMTISGVPSTSKQNEEEDEGLA